MLYYGKEGLSHKRLTGLVAGQKEPCIGWA
jgi:hypothetical protein